MYVRSLQIWQDMQRRGILTGEDAAKPEEVAREIARCDASLRSLRDAHQARGQRRNQAVTATNRLRCELDRALTCSVDDVL